MRLVLFIFLALLVLVVCRRYRRSNEIGVVNLADANVKLRCQSIIMDHLDKYLGPDQQFRFKFLDIDQRNLHFWCDAYGLYGFSQTFDVFGRLAPLKRNITWFIKQDGLYMDNLNNRTIKWFWNYPSFKTYWIE